MFRKTIILLVTVIMIAGSAGCSGSVNGVEATDNAESSSQQGAILWPENTPDEETVISTAWEFDRGQISQDDIILAVSPSGKSVLTVDIGTQSINDRLKFGANQLGWQLTHISLYSNQNGAYELSSSIALDAKSDPELNDTLASTDEMGVAWSADETRVCVSGGATRNLTRYMASNIYLFDFSDNSVKKLTDFDPGREPGAQADTSVILPRWYKENTITFIKYERNESVLTPTLMSLDIITGELKLESDLCVGEEETLFIFDYAIYNDTVYYSRAAFPEEYMGISMAKLNGGQESPQLLLGIQDVNAEFGFPTDYFLVSRFVSVQISPDGRWMCLTVENMQFNSLIFPQGRYMNPFVPEAYLGAIGREYVPSHNVLLFDLENGTIADPFTSDALYPDIAIVTAATFAPDGNSLLCAVYGDGGYWAEYSKDDSALYQIRLDDGSFDTVRIYSGEIGFTPEHLSWYGNKIIKMSSISERPFNNVRLLIPSVFSQNDKLGES